MAYLTYRFNGSAIAAQILHETDRQKLRPVDGFFNLLQRVDDREPIDPDAGFFQLPPRVLISWEFLRERHDPGARFPFEAGCDERYPFGCVLGYGNFRRSCINHFRGRATDTLVGLQPLVV